MPLLKASFARLSHADPAQADSLAQRLKRIAFQGGEGYRVLGVDREPDGLKMQVVARKLRDVSRFDEERGKFLPAREPMDRELYFNVDLRAGIASTAGGKRDIGILVELLKRAGVGSEVEARPIAIDLSGWVRALVKLHDTAQLAQIVVDNLYVEPRLIGRFAAKSVDNRLDLAYVEKVAGQLRSLRLGFFHEGQRRTVEARVDAALSITSSEEEDAERFFGEMRALLLKHQLETTPGTESAII